jgi:hypothetical protein
LQAQFAFREHQDCDFFVPYYFSRHYIHIYVGEIKDCHVVITDYLPGADLLTYASINKQNKKNPCEIFSQMAQCYIKAEQAGFLISDGKLANWGLNIGLDKVVLLDTKAVLFSSEENNIKVYNPENTQGLYHSPVSTFHITPDAWHLDTEEVLSVDAVHTYALGISLVEYITGESIIETLGGPESFKKLKKNVSFYPGTPLIDDENMTKILTNIDEHEHVFYSDLIQGLITKDAAKHISMKDALDLLKKGPKAYKGTENKTLTDEKQSEQKALPNPIKVTSKYDGTNPEKENSIKTTVAYKKDLVQLTGTNILQEANDTAKPDNSTRISI